MDKHMIDEAMEVLVEAYAELHTYRTTNSAARRRHTSDVAWPEFRHRLTNIFKRSYYSPALLCGWNGTDKPDLDGMRARLIKFLLSDRAN